MKRNAIVERRTGLFRARVVGRTLQHSLVQVEYIHIAHLLTAGRMDAFYLCSLRKHLNLTA